LTDCLRTVCFAIALLGQAPAAPPVVTVSAAISLTDALEEAARTYRDAGGAELRFNFAGSNVLARQILNGAPVDLFISADEAQMKLVEDSGAIAPGTRIDLLANRLAVVLSSSAPAVNDAGGLAQPAIRRLALGDPQAVPAGVYAKQYLQATGVCHRLRIRPGARRHNAACLRRLRPGCAPHRVSGGDPRPIEESPRGRTVSRVPSEPGGRRHFRAAALPANPRASLIQSWRSRASRCSHSRLRPARPL
jgi:molybdate transport system substrate-binding protein